MARNTTVQNVQKGMIFLRNSLTYSVHTFQEIIPWPEANSRPSDLFHLPHLLLNVRTSGRDVYPDDFHRRQRSSSLCRHWLMTPLPSLGWSGGPRGGGGGSQGVAGCPQPPGPPPPSHPSSPLTPNHSHNPPYLKGRHA